MNQSNTEDKIIFELLQFRINDLIQGKKSHESGWRNLSDVDISPEVKNKLYRLGIVELNNKDIRIKIDINSKKNLTKYHIQLEQIDYFSTSHLSIEQDKILLEKSKNIISQIYNFVDTEEIFDSILVIGLWKMFDTSPMSIYIDNVLNEGFSPKEWAFVANHSAPYLAVTLVSSDNIKTLDNAFKKLHQIKLIDDYPQLVEVPEVNINKVMKLLKWDKITSILSEENIHFLGICWFFIFINEYNNTIPLYSEFSMATFNLIKEATSKILKKNWEELTKDIERSLSNFNDLKSVCISDIIFIPEVI